MHLGNGAITPGCAVVSSVMAASGLAFAGTIAWRLGLTRQKVAMAGAVGAAIFAAQAVNVPVSPWSSAHLVGGVLAAWVLGPAIGPLVMAAVLAIQALWLHDGAVSTLGVNIINMGLLPALAVTAARRGMANQPWHVQVGVAALASIIGAATLIIGEVALFRPAGSLVNLGGFARAMLGMHALIALAEAGATVLLIHLMASQQAATVRRPLRRVLAVAAITAALFLAALPWSSHRPDGYESAAQHSGLATVLNPQP